MKEERGGRVIWAVRSGSGNISGRREKKKGQLARTFGTGVDNCHFKRSPVMETKHRVLNVEKKQVFRTNQFRSVMNVNQGFF